MEKINNFHLNCYIEAAKKLNINYKILDSFYLVEFKKNKKKWNILKASVPINPLIPSLVCNNKHITQRILKDKGFPVPKFKSFSNKEEAKYYFLSQAKKDKLIVIKPTNALGGKGITIKPKNTDQFLEAFDCAKKYSPIVLIEDFIRGKNYRVVVLGNKVIAVCERLPSFIRGDGENNIKKLIEKENQKRKNKDMPEILYDDKVINTLKEKKIKQNEVIKKNKKIVLRENTNMSTGGVVIDKTLSINEDNKKLCIEAVKKIGLKLCGVDLIIPDIGKSYKKTYCAINEMNHNPGLRLHYLPYKGEVRDVAYDVQEFIYNNI